MYHIFLLCPAWLCFFFIHFCFLFFFLALITFLLSICIYILYWKLTRRWNEQRRKNDDHKAFFFNNFLYVCVLGFTFTFTYILAVHTYRWFFFFSTEMLVFLLFYLLFFLNSIIVWYMYSRESTYKILLVAMQTQKTVNPKKISFFFFMKS